MIPANAPKFGLIVRNPSNYDEPSMFNQVPKGGDPMYHKIMDMRQQLEAAGVDLSKPVQILRIGGGGDDFSQVYVAFDEVDGPQHATEAKRRTDMLEQIWWREQGREQFSSGDHFLVAHGVKNLLLGDLVQKAGEEGRINYKILGKLHLRSHDETTEEARYRGHLSSFLERTIKKLNPFSEKIKALGKGQLVTAGLPELES